MSSRLDPKTVLAWMAESFVVCPERGSLFWKRPPYNHPRLAGTEAGHGRPSQSKTYCVVKMRKVALKRGRLIFLWVHKRWPSPCVDHIDGNSLNDSISNLREATPMQNAWNHKDHTRRLNLPMGVRLNASSGRYSARLQCNGQKLHLGAYDTPDEAERAYRAKRKELFGEFA